MKFIHLTDTHMTPPHQTIYGQSTEDHLNRAIASINQNHMDADFIVITGDLTQWGDRASFENLHRLLKPLKCPYHLLVGNHDQRDMFRDIFPDQIGKDGFIQRSLQTDEGTCLFLDTVDQGHDHGRFCETRLKWIERELEAAPGDVFIFMHHPPLSLGVKSMDDIGLKDRGGFEYLVKRFAPKIRHLFFGHVHRMVSGSWQGIPFSSTHSMMAQIHLDFSGTEIYWANKEAPRYSVVTANKDNIIVHQENFLLEKQDRFNMLDSGWEDWCNPPKTTS